MRQPSRDDRLMIACALVLFVSMLLACSDEPSAPPPSPEPIAPPPAEEVDDEEEVIELEEFDLTDEDEYEDEEPTHEYVYSPIGKRDPFRSPFQDLVAMDILGRERQERLTPLQRFDLDQLRVQAIISATADPMAMVIDPDGHGHIVRRGVLMGRNWGRVTAIRRECLVITEQMRDASGTPMSVQQERCLPKDEREARFEAQMRQQLQ